MYTQVYMLGNTGYDHTSKGIPTVITTMPCIARPPEVIITPW